MGLNGMIVVVILGHACRHEKGCAPCRLGKLRPGIEAERTASFDVLGRVRIADKVVTATAAFKVIKQPTLLAQLGDQSAIADRIFLGRGRAHANRCLSHQKRVRIFQRPKRERESCSGAHDRCRAEEDKTLDHLPISRVSAARATANDAPGTGSAISPGRRCQNTLRSLSSPFASACHSLSDNRSLRFYRCRGPLVLTGARKNGPSTARPHLVDRTTGCRLVLTPGVCHVPYRTVLLSQFGGRSAYDRQTPGRRAGPAAEGEGASDGGRTSSQGRLAARRLPP